MELNPRLKEFSLFRSNKIHVLRSFLDAPIKMKGTLKITLKVDLYACKKIVTGGLFTRLYTPGITPSQQAKRVTAALTD